MRIRLLLKLCAGREDNQANFLRAGRCPGTVAGVDTLARLFPIGFFGAIYSPPVAPELIVITFSVTWLTQMISLLPLCLAIDLSKVCMLEIVSLPLIFLTKDTSSYDLDMSNHVKEFVQSCAVGLSRRRHPFARALHRTSGCRGF